MLCFQVAGVEVDEVFRVEVIDWTNGQIKDNDSAEDVKNIDLTSVHNLSGPISVKDKVSREQSSDCPGCIDIDSSLATSMTMCMSMLNHANNH